MPYKGKRYLVKTLSTYKHSDTPTNALKLSSAGAEPRTPLGKLTTRPRHLSRLEIPLPHDAYVVSASGGSTGWGAIAPTPRRSNAMVFPLINVF